ncbi:MAG: endonuclease, partial [Gemmatimonadota bacterium]|nr:endonuclease [Gemmatimonadota bacterium]
NGRPLDPAVDYDELARLTKGRVGSDIKFLVDEAAREVLRTGDEEIRMEHLRSAIRRNGPSVGEEDLVRYERMHRKFERGRAGEKPKRIGF